MALKMFDGSHLPLFLFQMDIQDWGIDNLVKVFLSFPQEGNSFYGK
jgi:hypothetical protein